MTSTDAPEIEGVYKLVAVERDGEMRPSMKLSTGKATYPSAKSVRRVAQDGTYTHDLLTLKDESSRGEEQLVSIVEDGELVYEFPDLPTIRETTRRNRRKIPTVTRRIEDADPYDVRISPELDTQMTELRHEIEREMG